MSKNKFLLGFFIGLLTMAVAVGGIGVGVYFSQKSSGTKTATQNSENKLEYLEKIIDAYYLNDINKTNLENGMYKGLLAGLDDPYSVYYTASEYKELLNENAGRFYGIGIQVSQDTKTGIITIVKVYKNSFAEKAGIKAKDVIYKVENQQVTGTDVDKVVNKIKGEKGSKVNITVYRSSSKKYIDCSVSRGYIDKSTVEYKMLDTKNKIGYILIEEFDQVTYKQFTQAVESLKKQKVKGIVFDLRDNPGGDYDVVSKILDEILPEGTVVYTVDKYGNKEEKTSDKSCIDLPMVVLQNNNSASASEIFSGAIKDYNVGTIVGDQSYGKGIVQSLIPLTDGSAVKITVQKYYTPKGINIHGKGITPDVKVSDNTNTKEDEQLTKGENVLKDKMGIKTKKGK